MKIKLYLCGGENPVSQYPLGLGYLKSNCENRNVTIDIVSNPKQLRDCDLIGLSSNAWGIREAVGILHSTKIPVVIGGQGTLWEKLIEYDFQNIVIGEGEKAFRRVIDGNYDGLSTMPHVLCEEQLEDIDVLKHPIRGGCRDIVPILSSRGCPFKCNFCSSQHYWKKVRFHSAAYFIDEVEAVAKAYPNTATLKIVDDLFIANTKRFFEIHTLWMQRQFNKRFTPTCFIRSNMFTNDIGAAMKEMGFRALRFGAESGSDRMLKILNKSATVADNQRAIDIGNDLGFKVTASFMHDLPGETESDRKLTAEFLRQNRGRLGVRGNYKFQAFPGTKFYNGEDIVECDMRVR
jgi:radical SAM superfamily enzyme YgiQ (UPF0313 family)